MFIEELRKIWRKERILLLAIIIFVFTITFLLPQIRLVTHGDEDASSVRVGIVRNWISQYGEQITPQEFEEIKQKYTENISVGQAVIATEPYFAENHVFTYEDYLVYSQNALNGVDGYSYDTLRKMRDFISKNTEYSVIYYQEYESLMQNYNGSIETKEYDIDSILSGRAKESGISILNILQQAEGQGSPLPYDFMIAANQYFVYISILCIILTMFISAPVMVNDNVSYTRQGQYSSKKGRKVYRCQYMSMVISLSIFVAAILIGYLLFWLTTGAYDFFDCSIFSFQIRDVPIFTGVSYGKYIFLLMTLVFILTNGIGGIVFYLSGTSHNYIEMLMKTLPVVLVGIILSLSLERAFFHSNSLFKLTGINGIEFLPIALIFIIGILINVKGARVQYKKQL